MNYRIGDILTLSYDATNLTTNELMFEKGTEVKIVKIYDDKVDLLFPDNSVHLHLKEQIPYFFVNKDAGKTYTNIVMGNGTPPKELQKYLPGDATWSKNYIWKVSIELEEREDKDWVCKECTNEFKGVDEDCVLEQVCDNCGNKVIPYRLSQITQ